MSENELTVDDKLKLLSEQLEEQKKNKDYINSVFSKINYIIGELRGKIISQEKIIRKLESRAVTAEEMVKQIDPLNLSKKFEKEKAHIEGVDAKIESFIDIAKSVKEEIVSVNNKVSALGSSKDLENMNKSLQNDLTTVMKKYSKLSIELEKSISYFNEMQKNYTASLKIFGKIDSVESSLISISKDQANFKAMLHNFVSKNVYNSKISEVKKYLDFLNVKYKEVIDLKGFDSEKIKNVDSNVKNIQAVEEVDKLVKKPFVPDDKDDLIFMRSY